MNVLTDNNIPLDWNIAYVGLKNNWITPGEIANAALGNQFKTIVDDDIKVLLEVEKNEPVDQFIALIEKIIKESGHTEPSLEKVIRIWQLGFLLSIERSQATMNEKLNEIENLWARLDYPDDWESFIYYLPAKKSNSEGEAGVYQNFVNYIVKERTKLSL